MLSFPGERMFDVASAARDMPLPNGMTPTIGDLLLDGYVDVIQNDHSTGRRRLSEALAALEDDQRDDEAMLRWLGIGCWAAGTLGDDEALRRVASRLETTARAHGAIVPLALALTFLAPNELGEGAFTAARAHLVERDELADILGRPRDIGRLLTLAWDGSVGPASHGPATFALWKPVARALTSSSSTDEGGCGCNATASSAPCRERSGSCTSPSARREAASGAEATSCWTEAMSVASLVASALATAPSPPGASPTRCVVISSDSSRAVAVSAGQPGARRDRRKRTIPTMMATTARPTSSHGHHVVALPSPAGAVVVAGAPVGGAAVVAGASVRGAVAGASVRGGAVAGASVAGGRVVGLPPAGAVVGTWVGRVTPDGGVPDPPPELEHDAPRIATATAEPRRAVAGASASLHHRRCGWPPSARSGPCGLLTASRAGRDANVGGVLACSPSARPTRRTRPRTGGRAARPRHRARRR